MRKRSKQVNIRMTENEYQIIKQKAIRSNIPVNQYIITSAYENQIMIFDDDGKIDDITHELKKIGNNLNQAIKLCHMGKITSLKLDDTLQEHKNTWQSLNSLTNEIKKSHKLK